MKDYIILHVDDPYDSTAMSSLEIIVDDYLKKGYVPIGGVSMYIETIHGNSYYHFSQAVAKK